MTPKKLIQTNISLMREMLDEMEGHIKKGQLSTAHSRVIDIHFMAGQCARAFNDIAAKDNKQ